MKKIRLKTESLTCRIVITLILLILPFNIAAIAITVNSIANARSMARASIGNMAALTMQQLDSRLSAMNDFFYNLDQTYPEFEIYMEQESWGGTAALAEVNIVKYFNGIVENKAFADVLFFSNKAYDRFYIGMDNLDNPVCEKSITTKGYLREFLETDEKLNFGQWGIAEIQGMQWLVKIYTYEDFYYGSMISLDEVEYILDQNTSFSNMEIRFLKHEESIPEKNGYLRVTEQSDTADFFMQLEIPVSEVYASLTPLQWLCIILAFFYVLLIPFLIYLIRRMVLKPLGSVSEAMVHLRNGEQDYRIRIKEGAREFVDINLTFNDMADRIKQLRIQNYEKELERQRIELRNLQLQIRPHFLMNMFNLLFSFAQIGNFQAIQKLSLYLSNYFRYLFQSGKDLQPFSLELELIKKYLDIAEIRYPDCVEVAFEIDEEALNVEIPPLLIHNFVENVFKHIVNHDKKIHLLLEAYTDEKEATFVISDDGPGMPQRMAEEINQGIFRKRENERVHVGIENSYRRLQYFYGGKGSLTVDSETGQGTCFTILIPLEGERNESIDRR